MSSPPESPPDAPRASFEELLAAARRGRAFDAAGCLDAKAARVNAYFAASALDAAVVGVSGGVDSAVVVGLLAHAATRPGSPLRRVVGVIAPVAGRGATRQDEAASRASAVLDAFGVRAWRCPLGGALAALVESLEAGAGARFDAWSEGQMLSVVRTPALYGAAALLQAHGARAVVVGTTNRDEGAYLGFFGKASDGMVDVQPISDLHKSEVYALARLLGVPAVVRETEPSGDVFDGRSDEEMIGAPYDFVELYTHLLCAGADLGAALRLLAPADAALFAARATAVERLHGHNAHKYRVGSPAVHLDVYPRAVPSGWSEARQARGEVRPPPGVLPGEWDPPPVALDPPRLFPHVAPISAIVGFAAVARGVLSDGDCARLVEAMAGAGEGCPVGVTGYRGGGGEIGSMRATAWSPPLAAALWERLRTVVPQVRFMRDSTPTDWFAAEGRREHRVFRAAGLSPVLRFMRYERGGEHYGHHDAGYDYGDGRRTLLSVVFYLTSAGEGEGGATRLLRDGQAGLPVWERRHDDWTRRAREDEVLARVAPRRGSAFVFDHRLCHDVEPYGGGAPRIIVRADVVYEAVAEGR